MCIAYLLLWSCIDIEGRSDNATEKQTLASLDCRYLGCRLGFSPVTYFALTFLRYCGKGFLPVGVCYDETLRTPFNTP